MNNRIRLAPAMCGPVLNGLPRLSSVTRALTRALTRGLLTALALCVPLQGQAQDRWPAKTVRIIVPYAAGGSLDLTMRLLGQRLTDMWGQSVIVENRPGAAGLIGADAVAKAPPDGYMLGGGASPIHTTNKLMIAKLPFDPDRDLTPIMLVAKNPLFLVVHPSVPAGSLPEFIAHAKANPGKLSYGSVGAGSPQHLSFELVKARGGINVVHVPYKGAAAAMQDLLAGHIHAVIDTTAMQQVRAGKLKALAVLGDERFVGEPNLPSFAEQGLPGLEFSGWFSLFGPANMPPAVVSRINADANKVIAAPEVKARLLEIFTLGVGGSPEDFRAFIQRQMRMLTEAVNAAGIKPE